MGPVAKAVSASLAGVLGLFAGPRTADAPAPASDAADPAEVLVGVVGPLSGRASAYGLSQREGATLAAEESPPVAGRRLRLVFADDEADQTKAGALARDLAVREGVAAFVGSIGSDSTHQIEMVAVKVHVPQLTTASTDPSVTDTGSPWIFRCLADDVIQARALVAHLLARRPRPGPASVALLSQDNRYGRMGIAEVEKRVRAAGGRVAIAETFASGTTEFSALAGRTVAAAPDAVVVWAFYREGAALLSALRAAGLSAEVFAGDGLASPELVRLAEGAAEGAFVTMPFDPSGTGRARAFVGRFEARFGHPPDSFAAHGYDAVACLVAAAKRAGSWDRAALRDALALTRGFPGVTGDLGFDPTGNDVRPVRLSRVSGGRFVPIPEAP